MKRINLGLIALMTLAGFLLAGCSSMPPLKRVTLVAEDIAWSVNEIDALVGQTVELTLRNDGVLDHDFVSRELDLDVLLSPGQSTVLSFVVDKAGNFEFICNIPGHAEAGMVGEFVIGE